MSDTSALERDAIDEARKLLDLAKTQRGGEKRFTEGRSYLVITRAYFDTYGDILPANEKKRILDDYLRLSRIQSKLEEKMGKRPVIFKLFGGPESLIFSQKAAILLDRTKTMSGKALAHLTRRMTTETDTIVASELADPSEFRPPPSFNEDEPEDGQGMAIISIPSDQGNVVVSTGETDADTTIMYEPVSGNAPKAAFLIPLSEIEANMEKYGQEIWQDM